MLRVTLRAADAGEAALEPATAQELLHGTDHNRTQGSRARLEAFLVGPDIAVEMILKQQVKVAYWKPLVAVTLAMIPESRCIPGEQYS
jgi:hypothetical protein